MPTINDLILAVAEDDMVTAGNVFKDLMQDKTNDYLDNVKINLAQSFVTGELDDEDEDVDFGGDDEVETEEETDQSDD